MRQRFKVLILIGVVLGFPLTLGACNVVVGRDCSYIAYDWPYPTGAGLWGPGCKNLH